MRFSDYKACVTLPEGGMLCFNARTGQLEIVAVNVKPANLESVSKDAVFKLKNKLDALAKKAQPAENSEAPHTTAAVLSKPERSAAPDANVIDEFVKLYEQSKEDVDEHTSSYP